MDTPKKCSHKVEKGKCFLFQNHKIFLKGSMVGVSDQPFWGPGVDFSKSDRGVQFSPVANKKNNRDSHTF